MTKVGVLGLGSFGYALLKHLDRKNQSGEFHLSGYARNPTLIALLKDKKVHPLFPGSSPLSENLSLTDNLDDFIPPLDVLILTVPSSSVGSVLRESRRRTGSKIHIVNTTKALQPGSGKTFSNITSHIFKDKQFTYTLIAGANLSLDLVEGMPMETHVASLDQDARDIVVKLLTSPSFKATPTEDLAGVEYASAFKNIISLIAGIAYGKNLSRQDQDKVIARACREAKTLILKKFGASAHTFTQESPSWGQDIRLSCYGKTRNRQLGIFIGQGYALDEGLEKIGSTTIESMSTLLVLPKLTSLSDYPLLSFLYSLFTGSSTPDQMPL